MTAAKAGSAVLGGSIATIIIWAITTYGHVTLPPEVSGSITTLIVGAIVYFVPNTIPPSAASDLKGP